MWHVRTLRLHQRPDVAGVLEPQKLYSDALEHHAHFRKQVTPVKSPKQACTAHSHIGAFILFQPFSTASPCAAWFSPTHRSPISAVGEVPCLVKSFVSVAHLTPYFITSTRLAHTNTPQRPLDSQHSRLQTRTPPCTLAVSIVISDRLDRAELLTR